MNTLSILQKGSKLEKLVTNFGSGPDVGFFHPNLHQSPIFSKALWVGLTHLHDISDSSTVTHLERRYQSRYLFFQEIKPGPECCFSVIDTCKRVHTSTKVEVK